MYGSLKADEFSLTTSCIHAKFGLEGTLYLIMHKSEMVHRFLMHF